MTAEAAKGAAKWCQSSDIKKLQCGWAERHSAEYHETVTSYSTCPECQNWNYGVPDLPSVVSKEKFTIGKTQGGWHVGQSGEKAQTASSVKTCAFDVVEHPGTVGDGERIRCRSSHAQLPVSPSATHSNTMLTLAVA